MTILAGDIGGTNARLAAFELKAGGLRPLHHEVFQSHHYPSLQEIVQQFLSHNSIRIEHACVGVAGPVIKGRSEAVNLPWIVDSSDLAAALGLSQVKLINDLEANAYGLAALEPPDFATINSGLPGAQGNAAVISAGTGLGEAGLYWDGKRHRPFATEGGHTDFGPRDDLQAELSAWLRSKFGHASWERVLSGPGLLNIYEFLRDTGRGEEPPWLAEQIRAGEPAVAISNAATERRSQLCVEALELFVSLYGAEAGNLALKVMAIGGVFLGGGIAPKISRWLKQPAFMEAFAGKGRVRPLLEAMPVKVILNDQAALFGAARCAALKAGLL